MKKFLLSIFAMFLAFANLQAEEVTVYTLEPAKGSNNSYAGNCDIAIGDITWNLTGNSTMIPWRIGGKSITNVDRTLYSKNPMVSAVDKVVLSIGTVNSITVNSAKLLVADNADFTNAVETPFTVTANSDSEIAVTAPAGSYYKFVFNVTVSDSSNRFIQISKAVFYSSTSGETTAAAAPSLPADCSFTESKTIEITNNEEGATVYYTTDGENFNEYVGEFTINETTTVKAYAQIGDDVATKSFEVTRTYTKIEAKTIAEVIEAGEGEAYTKGTVVATYAKGFLLNDETGYILVYQGSAPTVAEGDVININGTTSMYGGLLQFAAGANIEKTGTAEVTHPEAVVMDGAAFDAFLTAPEVKYVEYIGTLTINGNYYNVAVEGAETAIASIQYPNDGLVTVESGEVIKVTGYTIGYNKSYVNTMAVKVEAYVEPEPEEPAAGIEVGKHYRIKSTSNGDYLTIGDTNENQYGHVHGAALDEANDNQVFTFIAVEGQENTYYVQSVAGKYFSYEGTGAGWNVNGTDDATKAHALTFEAAEGELQYLIKCYNASKSDYKYFKYEYVNASGKYHPFNDADLGGAEVWTLEEVAVVEPEPETPFEVVAVTPTEAVAELTTVTVEFSEEIEGTFDMMAMTQIYLGTRSNGCSFEVNGKILTITPFNAINTPGEYKLVIPEGLITRKSNGEAVTMNGDYVFTVKEAEAPFEVIAVTPTEAVEELTTVTVEFSEEIEGTFDMMAMTQIYLGTRSNGCSFEVNGKLLTITPFNAINTPGEYKLVIPEGLITRKSNGEAVTMNGEYAFTVKEATVEPEVIPAANKSYTVVAEGHNSGAKPQWAINDEGTAFVSTGNTTVSTDAQKQFAFVTNNGATYIYSVSAKKFILKDGSLAAKEGDAVEINKLENGKFFFRFDASHNVNIGGSKQMVIDGWDAIDGGNQFTLAEAGEFDPAEALAALNSTVEVVYVYMYNGVEIGRTTVKDEVGNAYPAVVNVPFGFTANTPEGVIEAAGEVNIECALVENYPIKYAATVEEIDTWYYMQMHSNNKKYIQYLADQAYLEWADAEVAEGEEDSYTWAFVGDPANGFKLVNRAAGIEKAVCSDGSNAPALGAFADAVVWKPAYSKETGNDAYFCLQFPGGNYMNAQNGKVAYWNDNDAGSTFLLTEREITVVEPETFTVTAALFPTVEGDVTEIKGIRVEAGQGPSLAELPTAWTLTNEAGDEFTMNIEWLYDYQTILIMVNPSITEAGTYTLTIPAGSLKTEDGKECEAAEFSWTIKDPTTGIENIEAETVNAIYDITGRKIEKITEGGIYIINGKKVLVK